jgi:hypothetical protein
MRRGTREEIRCWLAGLDGKRDKGFLERVGICEVVYRQANGVEILSVCDCMYVGFTGGEGVKVQGIFFFLSQGCEQETKRDKRVQYGLQR